MPIFTLRLKSMPSTNSTKPCTKCCRDCSPSVTMSSPASSCALSAAIDPCLKQYPSVRLAGIDDYGQVYARAPEHTDVEGFERCSREAIERGHLALIGTGKLAETAAPATVAIKQAYSAFLVPV